MYRRLGVVVIAATMGAAACRGQRDRTPDLQTQTPEQPVNQPITVTGCVRSGMGENTFVLNAARTKGAVQAATYNLTGRDEELRRQIGQEVEVSGTLRTQQTVATSGKLEEKPSRGAQGTPNVETRSEVDVRRLEVASIKPTGNRCEGERQTTLFARRAPRERSRDRHAPRAGRASLPIAATRARARSRPEPRRPWTQGPRWSGRRGRRFRRCGQNAS